MINSPETTKEERDALIQMSREDLAIYCQAIDPRYNLGTPHILIAESLMRVWRGEIDRLIITVPPRTGKSTTACVHFPAWGIGNDPTTEFVIAGHTADLTLWFSRSCKAFMETDDYHTIFPWVGTAKGQDRADEWKTPQRGGMIAVWVGGSITGRWGKILIADDLHKDYMDAMSKNKREKVWEWYRNTFYTRLNDINVGAIIIIMTRWHDDDVVGRVLQEMNDNPYADKWTRVDIPAITDSWGSYYPEKYTVDNLMRLKHNVWPIGWNAQYMQNPTSDETRIFKSSYIRYYEEKDLPADLAVYSFQDLAISEKQTADYNAIVTIGISKDQDIYVLSYTHYQWEPDPDDTFEVVEDWNPIEYGIETVAFQKMYANTIHKEMKRRKKFFSLREVQPMWEKHARIVASLHARFARWSVYFKKDMVELEEELQAFPNGKHDDLIDALSGAVIISETPIVPREIKKKKDPLKTEMVYKKGKGWVVK